MKQCSIEKLRFSDRYSTIHQLKQSLGSVISNKIQEIGYIEPGHGTKGKKHWIVGDEDLTELYGRYQKSRDILLWCRISTEESDQRKRTSQSVDATKSKKTSGTDEILNNVLTTVQKLKGLHESVYTVEQYNCWGHMIQSGKHASMEFPPDLPFFKKSKYWLISAKFCYNITM